MSVLSLANSGLSLAASTTSLLAHGNSFGPTQSALFDPAAVISSSHLGYEDPSERLKVMITGGGTASGGPSLDGRRVFSTIFSGGVRPNTAVVVDEVTNLYGLLPELQSGQVYLWLEDVVGSPLPRFHALAALPVLHSQLYGRLADFEDWADWMPGIVSSKNLSPQLKKPRVQELVLATAVGRKLYSQNLVETEFLSGGEQVHWRLQDSDKFEAPEGHTGFKTNEGSWTITRVPGSRACSLVAYQAHCVPYMPDWALATFKMAVMGQVKAEFANLLIALENRTRNPSWKKDARPDSATTNYVTELLR